MTKPVLLRLLSLLGAVWLVTALAVWLLADPSDNLVVARGGRGGARPDYNLALRDLRPAAQALEKNTLWGLRRDGSVAPKPEAKKAEEKLPEWRVMALVAKDNEKHLLIRIVGQPSATVRENERLPDGRRVIRIEPKLYVVENADGEEETVILTF